MKLEPISSTDARKPFIKVRKYIRLLYVHTENLLCNYNTLYLFLFNNGNFKSRD